MPVSAAVEVHGNDPRGLATEVPDVQAPVSGHGTLLMLRTLTLLNRFR